MKVNIVYLFLLPLFIRFGKISEVFADIFVTDILLVILLLYLLVSVKISLKYVLSLCIIFLLILIPHLFKTHLYVSIIKQFINIFIYFTYSFLFVKYNRFNIEKIFIFYINIIKVVIIISFIQLIAFYIDFKPLYDFRWILTEPWKLMINSGIIRLNSIFSEPSYFGLALSPLVYISVHNLLNSDKLFIDKKWSILILISSMLTFSALSYLSITMSFLLLKTTNPYLRYLKPIIITPFLLVIVFLVITNPIISDRFMGLIQGFTDLSQSNLNKINISAFSLLNNLYVAIYNFTQNPLFGGGIGSHPILYEKIAFSHISGVQANVQGGASMILRLLSEFGLFGLFMVAFFMLYFYNNSHLSSKKRIMNKSILIYLILIFIRISDFGFQFFPLFTYLYMFTSNNKNLLQ